VRPAELATVLSAVEAARQAAEGRAHVEPARRDAVRRVANVLGLGHMGETHFLFASERFRWNSVFVRAMGRDGVAPADPVRVSVLRQWIDEVTPPAGLRPDVSDLIICAWAALHNRAWYRGGSPFVPAPKPGSLTPDLELRPEPAAATERAGKLFGYIANPYLTGPSVAELTDDIKQRAKTFSESASTLVDQLERAHGRLAVPADATTGRLATARGARDFVAALMSAHDRVAMVEALARRELPATAEAVSRSLATAAQLNTVLAAYPWERLQPVIAAAVGGDERARAARSIVERLCGALIADELAQALPPALKRAEDDVFGWLAPVPGAAPTSGGTPPSSPAGTRRVRSQMDLDSAVDALRAFADEHRARTWWCSGGWSRDGCGGDPAGDPGPAGRACSSIRWRPPGRAGATAMSAATR
jgi:hypothetical protein